MPDDTTDKLTFSRRGELFIIACPENKPFLEVWHKTEDGFGARIMRENKRNGKTRRSYICRYTNADGKDIKEVLGQFDEVDFDDAQQTVRDRRRARSTAKHSPAAKQVPTLAQALERYITNKADLKDSTVDDYRKKFDILNGTTASRIPGKPLFTETTYITELDDERWLALYQRVARERGRTSALMLYRTAHAVYEHHVGLRYLDRNPLRIIKEVTSIKRAPPSKKIIPAKQLPVLWNWMQTQAQPATRDFLLVALFAGLRAGVIGGLKWEHVDAVKRTYSVPADAYGNKANVLVEVPIPDILWERVFGPRLAGRRPSEEWVISSAKLAGQAAVSVRSAMEGVRAKLNIDCSPHTLRRTFGSLAGLALGDGLLVSRMLTHNTSSTTRDIPAVTAGYIHYEEDTLRDAFNKTAEFILSKCTEPVAK